MSRSTATTLTISLIAVGAVVCAVTSPSLVHSKELDTPPNPFGINRSPYGEVFAMALQGPIDDNFHVGMYGATMSEMDVANESAPKPGEMLMIKPEPEKSPKAEWTVMGYMASLIDTMQTGHIERTNPLPASQQLKFYLRRQAEDKLRFAYNLDPSHYANYNSLHFFLTEGITTRPELVPTAGKLADRTIDYCMAQKGDPRPALTAAAACTNMLHIMFQDAREGNDTYRIDDMQFYLDKLDECLGRYESIAQEWNEKGYWDRLSKQRFQDCVDRYKFNTNIRNAAAKTISRLEKEADTSKQSLK